MRRSLIIVPLVVSASLALPRCHAAPPADAQDAAGEPPVVIPFDFESTFDQGRYGRMVGDSVWKKLERLGGFVIPESMLDVRAWSQRRGIVPNHETTLEAMQQFVCEDFGAQIGIWGKVERAAGSDLDEYELWIKVADFSQQPPRMIYETQARTRTVSEIPHVYLKAALDLLAGTTPPAAVADEAAIQRRWQTAANLVRGDFERGQPAPLGWDPLPNYVQRVAVQQEGKRRNQVIRFQFPSEVAATTGVLYYSDYFPIEEGATYRFQCRWRTTGSAAKVFIKCYHELPTAYRSPEARPAEVQRREVYRSQQNLKGPAGSWNVHTEDFTPKHTQYVPRWGRVMLYAYWPAGTVDWDEIVVKQIQPPPAAAEKVKRPSLETKVLSEELPKGNN